MSESIEQFISRVRNHEDLTRDETRKVFEQIMTGTVAPTPMGEFLKALAAKGETVDEIAGAADIMNEKVTRVRCDADCIDTCGTGGDGISTFNVSTTAALIAAAAGAVVAKHGNRTHTRVSGSAEAISALGVNINAPVPVLEQCLRDCGIAFLYAPHLHPAMKYSATVRTQLGIRTIFNFLGPLTNPAGARRQLLGVPEPGLTEKIGGVLAARGATLAWVVHGFNSTPGAQGLCDCTITGETRVTEARNGQIRTFTLQPADAGLALAPLETLLVDSPQASADVVQAILNGHETGPRRDHALLNAGAALVIAGLAGDIAEGVKQASDALDNGRAAQKLEELRRQSQE